MPDDSDGGIVGEIVDTAGDVGGAIVSGLAKLGKSAASQVTGSAREPSPDNTSAKSPKAEQASTNSNGDHSIFSEFKKIGQTAIGQITGREELAAARQKDEEASKREYAQVRSKVEQMYADFAAKRAREQKREEVLGERQEEQQKQIGQERKKETPRADIQKTRAEIKNYGVE